MKRVNSQVAERLAEVARILGAQGANAFRVGAYRRAAAMLRGLERPIDEIVRTEGIEGLQKLPGIGFASRSGACIVICSTPSVNSAFAVSVFAPSGSGTCR